MLKKIPEIEQPFRPYDELYSACFINYEDGYIPIIAPGVALTGLVDCRDQVTIEKDVFAGHDIMILTGSHDYEQFGEARKISGISKPVTIKEGAWLGTRCIILPGVTVGEHSVVGAGAIVTKDVEPYTVVAGNPARVIKKYNKETKEWLRISDEKLTNG